MLSERQKTLLNAIIDTYRETGVPVGSKILASQAHFDLSPATIRNEMVELEVQGYIAQPHTSAGRVPTEKAYRFFVSHFLKTRDVAHEDRNKLERDLKATSPGAHPIKEAAKTLAELCEEVIIVGFTTNDLYYTGLSHLFQKPEFQDVQLVVRITDVLDHFEDAMAKMYPRIDGPNIFIGTEHPFHPQCSFLAARFSPQSVIGILGPMRMDYNHHLALLTFLTKSLSAYGREKK